MQLPLIADLNGERDVRHRIRQLRWFEASFRRNLGLVLAGEGLTGRVDRKRLTRAFLTWLEAFHATRHFATINRRDYVHFCAGRMLAELLRHDPVSFPHRNVAADWPQGTIYTSFCLGIALSVLEQDFQTHAEVAPIADDVRLWWSFRDNAQDNPDFAIPFMDLLLGQTPNWDAPALPERRLGMRQSLTQH